MAKRKRLTPANPLYLDEPPLEAKSMLAPVAPIAGVASEASATAALAEMADTLTRAREEGRMILSLPLQQIALDHLVRDRIAMDEPEMKVLMASLRARGQQTPIEVVALGPDRYGLISGWRRCQALMRLAAETSDDRFTTVQALLRRPSEASEAYLAMVEENEIRVDLSYYERARIAAKAVEQGVYDTEKAALQGLFHAASRAKRSKIGSFLSIVHALDGALRFPDALSERFGLTLSRALEDDAGLAARLRAALEQAAAQSAEAEQAVLEAALAPSAPDEVASSEGPQAPAPGLAARVAAMAPGSASGSVPSPAPSPSSAAPSHPAPAAERGFEKIGHRSAFRDNPDGTVTLSGMIASPAKRAALMAWLKTNG